MSSSPSPASPSPGQTDNPYQSIANAIIQSQANASKSAFLTQYDPNNSPALFQSDPSLEKMPNSVIQQIKCKICPAPLGPEVANAQLTAINNTIQKQADLIELLENKVNALESFYKISFQSNGSSSTANVPSLTVSGGLPNVLLNFNIKPPAQGPVGGAGMNGRAGSIGKPGPQGIQGPTGYWGNME